MFEEVNELFFIVIMRVVLVFLKKLPKLYFWLDNRKRVIIWILHEQNCIISWMVAISFLTFEILIPWGLSDSCKLSPFSFLLHTLPANF